MSERTIGGLSDQKLNQAIERLTRRRDVLADTLRILTQERDRRTVVYRCVVCNEREVFPSEGEDTCSDCLRRI